MAKTIRIILLHNIQICYRIYYNVYNRINDTKHCDTVNQLLVKENKNLEIFKK